MVCRSRLHAAGALAGATRAAVPRTEDKPTTPKRALRARMEKYGFFDRRSALTPASLLGKRKIRGQTRVIPVPRASIETPSQHSQIIGAGNEARTRDLNLGKVALYQLSYSRPEQTRNCRAVPAGVKEN